MNDDNPDRGPLQELRAALDQVDHELLSLLVRRMGIVADIAERKREHRVRIRDLSRERRILDDRCAKADELGLPPDSIESIWRQLMLMSRERQAALRAEVPPELESKRIGIVGGAGGMGRSLGTLFSDLGHAVLVADLDTELTGVDVAQAADVVVISVPIRETRAVIEQVGPHLRPEALLMDVTSIKADPMEAMLASTQASVVGTHPMFGPGVNTYQGQRIVVCPGRGEAWLDWARQMFGARGLLITETTPEHHDAMMAIVQVLHHFKTQVIGLALRNLGVPLEETLRFTSPAYLLEDLRGWTTLRAIARALRPHRDAESQIGRCDRCVSSSRGRFGGHPRHWRPSGLRPNVRRRSRVLRGFHRRSARAEWFPHRSSGRAERRSVTYLGRH